MWEEESEDVFTSDEEEGDLARLITNNNDDTAVELNSKSAFAPPPSPGKGAGGDGEVEAAWAALRQDLATARAIARRLATPATQHQPGVTRVRVEPGPGDTGAANSGEYLMLNIIGISASISVTISSSRRAAVPRLWRAAGLVSRRTCRLPRRRQDRGPRRGGGRPAR